MFLSSRHNRKGKIAKKEKRQTPWLTFVAKFAKTPTRQKIISNNIQRDKLMRILHYNFDQRNVLGKIHNRNERWSKKVES